MSGWYFQTCQCGRWDPRESSYEKKNLWSPAFEPLWFVVFFVSHLSIFGVGSHTILTQKIYTLLQSFAVLSRPRGIFKDACATSTLSNCKFQTFGKPYTIPHPIQGSKPIVWLEKLAIQLPDITRPLVPCYPGQEISTVRWQPLCRGHRSCLAA